MQKAITVFKGEVYYYQLPSRDILLNKRSELIGKCRHENKNVSQC